ERGVRADRDGVTRVDLGELVDHDDVREIVHPRAAELLRPGDAEHAELGHPLHIVPREAALEIVLSGARPDHAVREVAHHVAHLMVLVGEVERGVHGKKYSHTSHVARRTRSNPKPRATCDMQRVTPYPVVPNPAAMQLIERSSAGSASSCPAR